MSRAGRNNKGSALMLVISTMAILSVVGSLLLVKTTNNRKMKEAEKKALETFNKAENGSYELVSALEMISQDAVKQAFSDLLIEYGSFSSNDARMERFNSVFVGILQKKLAEEGAEGLLKKALHLSSTDSLDMTVSFGSIETEADADRTDKSKTNKITIKDAKFTYKDASGNETTVITDIVVVADIPDVKKGMSSGTAAAFEDFALITNGNASYDLTTTEKTELDGNIYVAKNLAQKQSNSLLIKDAAKLLIKGQIALDHGAELVVENSDSLMSSGVGLWAGDISVDNGSKLTVKANCYVKDDLTLAGTNTNVKVSGTEYIGYSGEGARMSEKSSAIMINTAKDITLDLSGLTSLTLRGSSYIQDKIWGNIPSLSASQKAANMLGILQGESLAYKEMQSIYLVPSVCSFSGKNPMLKSEYESIADHTISMSCYFHNDATGEDASIDLSNYVNPTTPYITRFVRLDGGSTEYVYLYLNFKDESAAAEYQKDYLNTWKGREIKEQMKLLGSASKVVLAQNNYTVSNLTEYNKDGDQKVSSVMADNANLTLVRSKSRIAERSYSGLFYSLDASVTRTIPADYDLISNAVLLPAAYEVADSVEVSVAPYKFYLYKGNKKTADLTGISGKKGILVINGDLTFNSTNFEFEGLVIVTGNVYFNSKAKLTANETAVEKLLENEDVKKYFRGQGVSGTNGSDGAYVSSESIKINFENWNRN